MAVQLTKRLLSREAWSVLIQAGVFGEDDRIELLKGEIVELSPVGSEHAACVRRLDKYVSAIVGDALMVSTQNPISLSDHSEPEPDFALLLPRDDFYAAEHPRAEDCLMVAEVADSSLEKDRQIKAPLYADAGISLYWVVSLPHHRIECYSRPENGLYKDLSFYVEGDSVSIPGFEGKIAVNDLLPRKK